MSYDIIYDRQFIRAEKEGKEVFFPIIYAGPSNCFEIGRRNGCGRRVRSWENYNIFGKKYATLEEMLQKANEVRERLIESNKETLKEWPDWDVYSDERFGYFSALYFNGNRKTTFGQYKGLFITGCKKALTVEELREFGVYVHVHSSIYSREHEEKFKAAGKEAIFFYPKTSKELVEKIDEFEEYLKDTPYVSLYISINASETTMKRIRRVKFPTKKTSPVYKEVDEYFVIHVVNIGYFYKGTRNGFRYSPYQDGGKRFVSAKAAERAMKRFKESHSRYTTVVENVKQKTTLKV
jgi:uncharacterized protein YlbG (UPF0298 family)